MKISALVKKNFPDTKADLFAVFIEKCNTMIKKNRLLGIITQHSWTFISTFEKMRNNS